MFDTSRGLLKYVIFYILSLSIYKLVVMSRIGEELNRTATPRDGDDTTHYLLMYFLFSWLTLGIAPFVWWHRLSARVGNEARARGLATGFGAADFWLLKLLGSLVIVGPFIYYHRLFRCTNHINRSYLQEHNIF